MTFEELEQKVLNLEQTSLALQDMLYATWLQVQDHDAEIGALQSADTALASRVTALEALPPRVTALEADAAALETTDATHTAQIADLMARLAALEAAHAPPAVQFGTLLTNNTANYANEYAAGVRWFHLETGWDIWEPTQGNFSTSYGVAARDAMKAAGNDVKLVLGSALIYPPAWVKSSIPGAHFVNQYGRNTTDRAVNTVWCQAVRDRVVPLFTQMKNVLGLSNFAAIRVGSAGHVECLLPEPNKDSAGATDCLWIYDANAQGGSGRPPGVAACPHPGWLPGTGTAAQAMAIMEWILDGLVDDCVWQMNLWRSLGFTGEFHLPMPGMDIRPSQYTSATNALLVGWYPISRGAVYYRMAEKLAARIPVADRAKVRLWASSMAENSGNPQNNITQADDQTKLVTDTACLSWSAMRWMAYLAGKHGFKYGGENPGGGGYGLTKMQICAQQMQAAGGGLYMYAHSNNLAANSGALLADLASVIAAY